MFDVHSYASVANKQAIEIARVGQRLVYLLPGLFPVTTVSQLFFCIRNVSRVEIIVLNICFVCMNSGLSFRAIRRKSPSHTSIVCVRIRLQMFQGFTLRPSAVALCPPWNYLAQVHIFTRKIAKITISVDRTQVRFTVCLCNMQWAFVRLATHEWLVISVQPDLWLPFIRPDQVPHYFWVAQKGGTCKYTSGKIIPSRHIGINVCTYTVISRFTLAPLHLSG